MSINKEIVENKVALLIHPTFGGGWSTWVSKELKEMFLFDQNLVRMKLSNKPFSVVSDYLKVMSEEDLENDGEFSFLIHSWEELKVIWIPQGERFFLKEHDGKETVYTESTINWEVA